MTCLRRYLLRDDGRRLQGLSRIGFVVHVAPAGEGHLVEHTEVPTDGAAPLDAGMPDARGAF
jgi:hypothetical protein